MLTKTVNTILTTVSVELPSTFLCFHKQIKQQDFFDNVWLPKNIKGVGYLSCVGILRRRISEVFFEESKDKVRKKVHRKSRKANDMKFGSISILYDYVKGIARAPAINEIQRFQGNHPVMTFVETYPNGLNFHEAHKCFFEGNDSVVQKIERR